MMNNNARWLVTGLFVGAILILVEARREMRNDQRYWLGRGWDEGYVQAMDDSGISADNWLAETDSPYQTKGDV